ncbi:MAG: polysaccharide deacetylase family protein, partial [Gammaproteobacteria bacterium]|nr:polysaccharide deacetylase family protein [Gammaproteobacteria bacterium]
FPLLREMSMPATIYLVSDMIGTCSLFWPERLSGMLADLESRYGTGWHDLPATAWLKRYTSCLKENTCVADRETLTGIINSVKSLPDLAIHDHIDTTTEALGLEDGTQQTTSLLDWEQIRTMLESGLIEVGSHTRRHTRLNADIPAKLMHEEIILSQMTIEQKSGRKAKTFCFPNGDYTPAALDLVRQYYDGAVTTRSGWNTVNSDRHQLSRIGVHNDITHDRIAFLARISGWL